MNESVNYSVVLFRSVSLVMQAEKILKGAGISFKLIPVPKTISTECGICIRFGEEDTERIRAALAGKVEYMEIRRV